MGAGVGAGLLKSFGCGDGVCVGRVWTLGSNLGAAFPPRGGSGGIMRGALGRRNGCLTRGGGLNLSACSFAKWIECHLDPSKNIARDGSGV